MTKLNASILSILHEIRHELAYDNAVAEEREWLMAKNDWSWDKANRWAIANVRDGISNKPRAVIEYANDGKVHEITWPKFEPHGNWTGD